MLEVRAVDPEAFFASWQAARLASADLKPMGAAGLQQALLVWRHWLAFCTVHGVAWDAARSADIAVSSAGTITVQELDALSIQRLRTADGAINATTGGQISLSEGAVSGCPPTRIRIFSIECFPIDLGRRT